MDHRTNIHSNRMRTARSSSHLLGGVSASVHSGIPPWVWAWRDPPDVGLETPLMWAWRPPRPDPSNFPWVWAWRPPQGKTPQLPPWVWAWRPARHAGIPPPSWRPARHAGTGWPWHRENREFGSFSRQGKHREFCFDIGKNSETQG